jgi:sugar/nucleoside kinase (ribokinase family)
MICGIPARGNDNKILPRNIECICDKLFQLGVLDRVIVHAPEAGWYMERNWNCTCVPSLMLPDGYIKGTVGAGDAFCAGILYSLLKGFDPDYSLRLASAAAAASLSEENSIDGMKAYKELLDLEKQFKRKPDIFNRL